MVVGFVSGVGVSFAGFRASFTLDPIDALRGNAIVASLLASRAGEAVVTDVVEAEDTFDFCGASAGALRAISRTIVSPM